MTPNGRTSDEARAELLNAAVDGTATPAQREALEALLRQDPSARTELEALQQLAELLARVRAPEPPDNLVDDVLMAARERRAARGRGWLARLGGALSRLSGSGSGREEAANLSDGGVYVGSGHAAPNKRSREETTMAGQKNRFATRAIFAGAAAFAVLALVVWIGDFYPPHKEDAYGTIGAANRYRSEQITNADVQLSNPEIQAFLASDTFDRIVRDPNARALLSNSALLEAIKLDTFRSALSQSSAGRDAGKLDASRLNDAGRLEASRLNDAGKLEASRLNDAGKLEASRLNDAGRLEASRNLAIGMTTQAMATTLNNAAVRDILKSNAAMDALASVQVQNALRNGAALSASTLRNLGIRNDEAISLLTSKQAIGAFQHQAVRDALTSAPFLQALNVSSWRALLKDAAGLDALTNRAVRDALNSSAGMQALNNVSFLQGMRHDAFGQLAQSPQALRDALGAATAGQGLRQEAGRNEANRQEAARN
jgi:hypothetical protein